MTTDGQARETSWVQPQHERVLHSKAQSDDRVRVEGFSISLDGYGAVPNQDMNNPLGISRTDLHQ